MRLFTLGGRKPTPLQYQPSLHPWVYQCCTWPEQVLLFDAMRPLRQLDPQNDCSLYLQATLFENSTGLTPHLSTDRRRTIQVSVNQAEWSLDVMAIHAAIRIILRHCPYITIRTFWQYLQDCIDQRFSKTEVTP